MVEIAEIRDRESFEKWLEDKPRELAVLLAHRTAVRMMPLYWAWASIPSTIGDLFDVRTWRMLPTVQVCSVFNDPNLQNIALNSVVLSGKSAVAISIHDAAINSAKSAISSSETESLISPVASANYAYAAAQAATTAAAAIEYPEVAAICTTFAAAAASAASTEFDFWGCIRRDAEHYSGLGMRTSLSL